MLKNQTEGPNIREEINKRETRVIGKAKCTPSFVFKRIKWGERER